MRRRIQQLASGKFDYTGPNLSLSTEKIELEVLEGKEETGDFVITSTNHVKMRGIIYSSNPRMECLTPQFEGEEVRIRYQFHSEGLIEGDIQKGEFFIVCNQGEYNLSFVVSISKLYADSSLGKIRSLNDFTNLSRESFEEAYHLFYSNNFKNLIKEEQEQLLYDSLRYGTPSGQKVEEFLVATNRKKPLEIELKESEKSYVSVEQARKEQIELISHQWGYIDIKVSSDVPFLIPGKKRITSVDFLGSTCFFDFYMNEEAMHAGKNFGNIYFEMPGKMLEFKVCADQRPKQEMPAQKEHFERQQARAKLMQLYIDFRLKKIVTGSWANQSIEILEHLSAMETENELWNLMKAQAFIINRQRQEASWILDAFKRECIEKDTPIWGYYLYLCTLMEREESYVDRLTAEIEQISHHYPKDAFLFWILLFIKEEYYRNSSRRLKDLESWILDGNDSPYLYLEASYLIWQDPYLLTRLDTFEVRILNWAAKQDAISKDIAMQVMNLLPEQRSYNKRLYPVLCKCYNEDSSDEMVAAICAYLIKGQQFGIKYHDWYALGIEREVRITNLYEAFLLSMDQEKISEVPKMIQMYFQYNSTMSYRHMAALFVNIIAEKEKQQDVYNKYRRTMEQFAMTQIEAGHIDENLAVVYAEMLKYGLLNGELAHHFAGILFTHKLSCKNKKIVSAIITQKQYEKPQQINVINGQAYFKVSSNDYTIVLVDNEGNCFAGEKDYLDEALLNPELYLEKCMELAPDEVSYLVYYFSKKQGYETFEEQDGRFFPMILQSESVSKEYKLELYPEVIHFFQKKNQEGMIEKYLNDLVLSDISAEDRRYVEELLVDNHMFEKAYQMIHIYGYDYLGSAARVALCSYEITRCGFEEDDFLLGFAEVTACSGKYNDIMLIYLCKFYNGPTKRMAEIWKMAGVFEIDTYDLEERIITQMLYSTDYIEYIDQIYDSYCTGGGKELVRMAYLSYFSHYYLIHDMVVSPHVFAQIKERYLEEKELNDACELGLLKNYAENGCQTETDRRLVDELLMKYTAKNIFFSFYKKLEKQFVKKYHFYDKFFLEYHSKPDQRIILNYSLDGKHFVKEEMLEVYDGIYEKEFILFFGEAVQYYVSEEIEHSEQVTESGQMKNSDVYGNEHHTRYDSINEMIFDITLSDEEQLKRCMKQYSGLKYVSEQIFKLL